MDSSASESKSK